jgi:hypothetical protein
LTSAVTPVRYKDKRHWLKTRSKLLHAGVSIAVMLTVLPFPGNLEISQATFTSRLLSRPPLEAPAGSSEPQSTSSACRRYHSRPLAQRIRSDCARVSVTARSTPVI